MFPVAGRMLFLGELHEPEKPLKVGSTLDFFSGCNRASVNTFVPFVLTVPIQPEHKGCLMKSHNYTNVPGHLFFEAGTPKKAQLLQQCSDVPNVPPKGGNRVEQTLRFVPPITCSLWGREPGTLKTARAWRSTFIGLAVDMEAGQ